MQVSPKKQKAHMTCRIDSIAKLDTYHIDQDEEPWFVSSFRKTQKKLDKSHKSC